MHILTINLSQPYRSAVPSDLSEVVSHTSSFDQACRLIDQEEYSLIIKAYDSEELDKPRVTQLLGLTPLSTKIILVGDPHKTQNLMQWQEMGIEVLCNPSVETLCTKVQTNILKFTD